MPWKITTPDGRRSIATEITMDADGDLTLHGRGLVAMMSGAREFTVEWVDDEAR